MVQSRQRSSEVARAINALSRKNEELLIAQFEMARWQVERAEKKAKVGHGKALAFGVVSPASFSVLAYTPQVFSSWLVQCAPASK